VAVLLRGSPGGASPGTGKMEGSLDVMPWRRSAGVGSLGVSPGRISV
jgi:hypothetical protein